MSFLVTHRFRLLMIIAISLSDNRSAINIKIEIFSEQVKIWLLYQKYAEKGYTSTKTHSYLGSDGRIVLS